MFEFVGLIGLVFVFGLICFAIAIIALPFYLLFRLLGFAVKVGFAGIFVALAGLILLPLAVVAGVVVLFNLAVIGIPLLIAFLLLSWVLGFFRRNERAPIVVQAVPPTSP